MVQSTVRAACPGISSYPPRQRWVGDATAYSPRRVRSRFFIPTSDEVGMRKNLMRTTARTAR